ncbi:MAG: bifunctional 3,4-dihydroxy-2-butanone-4-phosphate synthase/GTP cyclohydrolase II [Deltaproteobacteria bacterium]|nr:bifunctional 3,4-dihydroxy-2-butanone-4-phosphate synthase/GTP cyclohydrolase II [Deltaproteobacteria bacterium]
MAIKRVEDAIRDIKEGRMVILVDDEDRENEGDIVIAAEKVTHDTINFMARYARGLICLAITEETADKLDLQPMVNENTSLHKTAFTISIDAKKGTTTGISAHDRALTILTAIKDDAKPEDLARPGHIFPLRGRKGGVLVRTGQTEGSIDLARLADMKPAGVICEIMKDDGTMARLPDLEVFAKEYNLKIVTVADIVEYRLRKERLVRRTAVTILPTRYGGEFTAIAYENDVDFHEHLALVKGDIVPSEPTLVRVHSECLTGDVFGSERCDCGDQLKCSMKMIERAGKGVVLYMHQEGRGIGLVNKLKAYALQDKGLDTVEANERLGFKADLRDYGIGAQILLDLGVRKMKLMTNNPKKIVGLEGYGLEIIERVPIEVHAHERNIDYLRTKKEKMGHIIGNLEIVSGSAKNGCCANNIHGIIPKNRH